ncbi:hypothetical protein XENTR_v10017117 [Xenopus tropicalis]|nr:hypothetical protein XENTR_v10017117 [Xenopus tropicalis]
MTLNVTMRRSNTTANVQQRWSIPADAKNIHAQKKQHSNLTRKYTANNTSINNSAEYCRRSWSSDSSDSVISSESGSTYYRVVLIGEQGVGKSTLANIFAGVPDSVDGDCDMLAENTYERNLMVDGESATLILIDMWENKVRYTVCIASLPCHGGCCPALFV